jgi:hypothetical protein
MSLARQPSRHRDQRSDPDAPHGAMPKGFAILTGANLSAVGTLG